MVVMKKKAKKRTPPRIGFGRFTKGFNVSILDNSTLEASICCKENRVKGNKMQVRGVQRLETRKSPGVTRHVPPSIRR